MNELAELIKPYNEYLIAASLIVGVLNLILMLAIFNEKRKIEKHALKLSEHLITNLTKEVEMKGPHIFTGKPNGFINPILFMFGAAWLAGLALFYVEVPPKKTKDDCNTTIIQYVEKEPVKPVKKKPISPCGVR